MFDVCTTGDTAHIFTILKFLPHTRQHVDACVARTLILYRCVPCHPWCTHRTSLVVKKNFFSFPASVNNSIKVGPLVFLLQMFVITEDIMKRPVLFYLSQCFNTLYTSKLHISGILSFLHYTRILASEG